MRRLVIAGLALALAGCGGGEELANNSAAPTPTPTPGPMLGGLDLDKPLRASGTGPYWAIQIAPGTITFTDKADAAPVDFYPVSPKLAGDTASFETQTPHAEPVTIMLTAKPCTAGKAQLPLTAEARIGGRVLKGCAGPGAYDWAERKKAQLEAEQRKAGKVSKAR